MPATASPFGLKPVYHPSGTIRVEAGTIGAVYNANLLQYQPVLIGTDGTLQAAATTGVFVGVFEGVEYTAVDGRPIVANEWIASTPVLAGTTPVAYYTRDPLIRYEIQASGAITQANLGNQAHMSDVTAGSTTTGLSTATLNQGTLTNSGQAQLRIVDFGREPNNAIGDAFTNVIVEISLHQDVAAINAYGG